MLTIILIPDSSALIINEIEANPDGEDSGFEWIEFYSETEVNLEGYNLDHEGRGAPINLSGIFSGFFILNLQTQWLRNSNETVYLKLNGQLIQTIGPFTDNKVDKTYSFCNNEWLFMAETKNAENFCENSNQEENIHNQEEENLKVVEQNIAKSEKNNSNNIEPIPNKLTELSQENQKMNKISLSKKEGSVQEVTRTYKTRLGVIYFFIGFCAFIVVLIALKKL